MSGSPAAAPAPLRGNRRRGDTADDFRPLADFAPAMIWVASPDRKRVYFNGRWLEFTGRNLEAELGAGWADGVHPDDRGGVLALYEKSFSASEPLEAEFRLRRHDGEYRWLIDKGVPLVTDGRLRGFVGSCLDITDRRLAEQAARNQFLSIVSHELRSPLNGIKSWTHVLESRLQASDPTIKRAIAGIMIGVEQQVRIIEELLDATRAMSGNPGLGAPAAAPGVMAADALEGGRVVSPCARVSRIGDLGAG